MITVLAEVLFRGTRQSVGLIRLILRTKKKNRQNKNHHHKIKKLKNIIPVCESYTTTLQLYDVYTHTCTHAQQHAISQLFA